LTSHQWGQFEILRIHHGAWAPTGPVVNPRAALGIERVVRAFAHDFPTPLGIAVDLDRMRVVAEFRAVVSRPKAVPTCAGFQSEHGFAFLRRERVIRYVAVKCRQRVLAFPEGIHALHISWRRAVNKREFHVQELLPVTGLQLNTIAQQMHVIRHVKNPGPAVVVQRQPNAIRRDVPGQFVAVHHFKRHREIRQGIIEERRRIAFKRVRREHFAIWGAGRTNGLGRPTVLQ